MSNREGHYLLAIEWDESVHRPQVVMHHRLTLPAESNRDDFERFMAETVLPGVASVLTRAGGVARAQFLRAERTSIPQVFAELRSPLPSGVHSEASSYRVIAVSSQKAS